MQDDNTPKNPDDDDLYDEGFDDFDADFDDEGFDDLDDSLSLDDDEYIEEADSVDMPRESSQEPEIYAEEVDNDQAYDDDFTEDEYVEGGSEKRNFISDLSFNAKVIIGAVILGVCVLAFQLLTAKSPQPTGRGFQSSVNMQGATEGIFRENNNVDQNANIVLKEQTNNGGLLGNPQSLDSLEIEIKDAPPMPTPISSQMENDDLGSDELQDLQVPRAPVIDNKPKDIVNIDETDLLMPPVIEVPDKELAEKTIIPELETPPVTKDIKNSFDDKNEKQSVSPTIISNKEILENTNEL